MAADKDALLAVGDVGEVIADSILGYFSDEAHRNEIERLRAAGLNMSMEVQDAPLSDSLAGKTIVISGNFSISRDEMKSLIELHGGKNSSSLSSRTSFLLAGNKPGPEKLKKAESLGVPVIDEEEFNRIAGIAQADSAGNEEGGQLSLF